MSESSNVAWSYGIFKCMPPPVEHSFGRLDRTKIGVVDCYNFIVAIILCSFTTPTL